MVKNRREIKKWLKYIVVVLICMAICGSGMYVVVKKKQVTYYSAVRSMVISHNITTEKNDENYSLDQQMMPTYKKIAEDKVVANNARNRLSKKMRKSYSSQDIEDMVSSKVTPQSLILTMEAKSNNPSTAVKLVNAMSQALQSQLPKLQPGAGKVRLLAPSTKQSVEKITTPHAKKYVAVGLALGGMFGLIICFIAETWNRLL